MTKPMHVIVTGGSSGIGQAVARVLGQRGHIPVSLDVAPGEGGPGEEVWPLPVDVSDEVAVETAIAGIEERYGAIDGLVNAAGVLGRMHAPDRLKMSHWDREMAVDLRGTYLTCRALGARMAERGRGSIVNIASVAGMTAGPIHGYGPAKAAVISMTANLAAEWGPRGVRVNAISPGFTRTPALEEGVKVGALDAARMTAHAALRRLVDPEEVARAVAFLIGVESSGITGINLPVDAGFLAGMTWDVYGVERGSGGPGQIT